MLMQAELVWLLAAVAKGDELAFERLYEATRAKLYGVVLRILGRPELAEEVMQETYLKIWKAAGAFDPTLASPITWMVAMARNRAIDIVRKKPELSLEDGPEALNVAADTPAPLARREMTEELKRLLSCLGKLDPEKQRIVFARLLQRLEPRSARQEARYSGEYHQDLVASEPFGNPRVHGTLISGSGRGSDVRRRP